jgi:hypothetical protein
MSTTTNGVPLEVLLQALGATVATAVVAPAGTDITIGAVALLEEADLGALGSTGGDLGVLVGVSAAKARAWVADLMAVDAGVWRRTPGWR